MPRSADRSLGDFAAALASVHPSPGGRCASAIPAALAAGLVAMVARQTAASEHPFTSLSEEMEAIATEADGLRYELLAVADADVRAFELAISARRTAPPAEVQAAYRAAVEPPLRVCALSLRVLELALDVAERGHPYAAPDAGAASLFASAALESAALSIHFELHAIDDGVFRVDRAGEVARAEDRARVLRESALTAVRQKLEPPRMRTRAGYVTAS